MDEALQLWAQIQIHHWRPLPSERGTYKTVAARLWPWLAVKRLYFFKVVASWLRSGIPGPYTMTLYAPARQDIGTLVDEALQLWAQIQMKEVAAGIPGP